MRRNPADKIKTSVLVKLYNRSHHACHVFFSFFLFFVVTRRPSAKRRFSQCCCRALHQSFLLLSDDPPRTLFGDHYYFPRARRSQICVGANSFLLVAGAKKISRQCGFWPKFISWRPGIFSPTPLSDTQETKLGARNCAQTVRKLCANCAQISKIRQIGTQYRVNLNV